MKIIGLTGGIASGKSSVAAWFSKQGVPVLDADQMAREVLKPESVRDLFGPEFLEQGQINRKKLGELVFSDPMKRAELEALTHPLIAKKLQEELTKLEKRGCESAIYEAALIFEKNIQSSFDATILVMASESVQLDRLLKRDNMTRNEALVRIRAQMPPAEKIKLATYVIDNSGDLESLKEQIILARVAVNRAIGVYL
ncbi:MAG: dephospho-CoA kinase [Myxococcaceae bacterium]